VIEISIQSVRTEDAKMNLRRFSIDEIALRCGRGDGFAEFSPCVRPRGCSGRDESSPTPKRSASTLSRVLIEIKVIFLYRMKTDYYLL
jgi:hypothetical protein